MRYLSVCSGIEAATVAWHPLGWQPAAFSEIEAFPSSVLAHHYPTVPNVGDMTKFREWNLGSIDLLVGGTPCQSFSVAGLRKGLADPRGNLMLTYLAIADQYRPKWLVWENVPGVLSSNGGRDFGTFLGGLGELGYGFAYRVLDAQYFGVPQRRRRVFVVGCLGDWRRAAAVLFERHSLRGHPAPCRQAGQIPAAGTLRSTDGGIDIDHATAGHIVASNAEGAVGLPFLTCSNIGKHVNNQTPLIAKSQFVPVAFSAKDFGADATENLPPTLRAGGFDKSHANSGNWMAIQQAMSVRRLTPIECERLQGFPDNYTLVPHRCKPAADGPRYKALGNSMAVPVMRWIGERIDMVEQVGELGAAA